MEPVRRRQLIEATIGAIHQYGLQNATVARICRRAGLSVGLVNHYFDGKGELFEETMQMLVDQTLADVEAGIASGTTPLERLMGFVEGHFAPGQRAPEAVSAWLSFYLQVGENAGFGRIQKAFDDRLLELLRPILADLVSDERCEGVAQTLIALAYGLWLRHAYDPANFGLDVVHRIAMDYVGDVITAAPTPSAAPGAAM